MSFVNAEEPKFVAGQPDVSAIFEKHAKLSTARTVTGWQDWYCGRRGNWYDLRKHTYARRKIASIQQAFGQSVHHTQWEFPDRIECKKEG